MHDELTKLDIKKMQDELDECNKLMPELIEEVKRTRAFGDLSENFEYKEAKRAQNKNRSRIRYLENMIKSATIIGTDSKDDEVGLFDKVEIYVPEDDEVLVLILVIIRSVFLLWSRLGQIFFALILQRAILIGKRKLSNGLARSIRIRSRLALVR